MSAGTAVATHGLAKRYGDVRAVEALDLHVRPGEIYGFLGRNGAGKTTTIRMLLGLVRPSGGSVELLGSRVQPGVRGVFERVGYLVESATAYPNLTVRENLDIQRRLTGSPRAAVEEAIRLMRLDACADRRAGVLRSAIGSGSRSRGPCCTTPTCSSSTNPPTPSTPPASSKSASCCVRWPASRVSLCSCRATSWPRSPTWPTASASCTRAVCSRSSTATSCAPGSACMSTVGSSEPERATALLAGAGFAHVERTDGRLRVFEAEERLADIARTLVGAGLDLTELTAVHEDLESYFLRLTGDAA